MNCSLQRGFSCTLKIGKVQNPTKILVNITFLYISACIVVVAQYVPGVFPPSKTQGVDTGTPLPLPRTNSQQDWLLSWLAVVSPPSHKGYSRHKSLKAYFWRDAASRVFKTRRIHVACAPMTALALAWAVMDAAALENELYSTVSDKQVPEFDGKKSRLGTIPSWWKDTTGFIIDTTWYYNTWEYTYIYIYVDFTADIKTCYQWSK